MVANTAEVEKPKRKSGRWISPLVAARVARRVSRTLGKTRARRPHERAAAIIAACAARASAQREGAAGRVPKGLAARIDAQYLQSLCLSLGVLRSVRLAMMGLRNDDYPMDKILVDVDRGASRAAVRALQILEEGGEFEEGAYFFRRIFPLRDKKMFAVPCYNEYLRYTDGVDLQSPVPFSEDFPYFDPTDISRAPIYAMEDDIVRLSLVSLPTAADFGPGGRFESDNAPDSDLSHEELGLLIKLADLTTTAVAIGKIALLAWNEEARETIDEMSCFDADSAIAAQQDRQDRDTDQRRIMAFHAVVGSKPGPWKGENDPGIKRLYRAVGPKEVDS